MGIAVLEFPRIGREKKLDSAYYPGDLGWDPAGIAPNDPEEFRAMQERELNNGRLGMIAAAGFIAQDAVSGTTWGDFLVPGVMAVSPVLPVKCSLLPSPIL